MLIEHPVVVIENLLKLNIGDEGRLLYLRKAITNGQIIYNSDKEFLKKMEKELELVNSVKEKNLDKTKNGISMYQIVLKSLSTLFRIQSLNSKPKTLKLKII
jgi:hypothetical protein